MFHRPKTDTTKSEDAQSLDTTDDNAQAELVIEDTQQTQTSEQSNKVSEEVDQAEDSSEEAQTDEENTENAVDDMEVPEELVQKSTNPAPAAISQNTQEKEEENMNNEQEEQAAQQPMAYSPANRIMNVQPSSYAPAHQTETTSRNSGENRQLLIGQGITMSGEIDACDEVTVEGTVEAALKGSRVLNVSETGTFYGTVEIEEATIAGRFEGDITVNGRLTIESTGTITGSIAYKELQIEAGAVVDGRISPLSAQSQQAAPQKARAKVTNATPGAAANSQNSTTHKVA